MALAGLILGYFGSALYFLTGLFAAIAIPALGSWSAERMIKKDFEMARRLHSLMEVSARLPDAVPFPADAKIISKREYLEKLLAAGVITEEELRKIDERLSIANVSKNDPGTTICIRSKPSHRQKVGFAVVRVDGYGAIVFKAESPNAGEGGKEPPRNPPYLAD